jgi:uncharacterized membrane protein YeiH
MVRDLLANRDPIGIAQSPGYVVTVLAAWCCYIFALVVVRLASRRRWVQKCLDYKNRHGAKLSEFALNLSMSSLGMSSVIVALGTQMTPLWIWGPVFGLTASFGGGIVCNLICRAEVSVFKGDLFPEIVTLWTLLLSVFFIWEAHRVDRQEIHLAILVSLIGSLATRWFVVRMEWRDSSLKRQ